MTPFLSGLVERASAADGLPAVRPIVPPLFAAGTVLAPGVDPASVPSERDQLSFTTPGASPEQRATAPMIQVRDREPATPTLPQAPSRITDREPGLARVAPARAHVPDTPPRTRTPEAHEHRVTDAPTRLAPGPAVRPDVRTRPVMPAPHPPQQFHSIARDPVPGSFATPAPIVRVTIGRIEVRAVTAPAPVPKVPQAAPTQRTAIVLEDYLRSGSGGR